MFKYIASLLLLVGNVSAQVNSDIVRSEQRGVWVSSIGFVAANANEPTAPLFVEIAGANVGAFGDVIAEEKTPLVQLDFVYGFNVQTSSLSAINGSVIDSTSSRLRLQSGTSANGSASSMGGSLNWNEDN